MQGRTNSIKGAQFVQLKRDDVHKYQVLDYFITKCSHNVGTPRDRADRNRGRLHNHEYGKHRFVIS